MHAERRRIHHDLVAAEVPDGPSNGLQARSTSRGEHRRTDDPRETLLVVGAGCDADGRGATDEQLVDAGLRGATRPEDQYPPSGGIHPALRESICESPRVGVVAPDLAISLEDRV